MVGFFEPEKNHSQKTRDALTGSMKDKIKELVGKCEYCNTQKSVNLLEVHHISEVATANGNSDKNTPGNLIVLCRDHHKLAHDGEISKKSLKTKISKRSEKRKSELRAILREREKITESRSSNPFKTSFSPPSFKPPKFKF
jgi:hypothetical protein